MESQVLAMSLAVVGLAFLSACGLDKVSFREVLTSDGWRKPAQVVDTLRLKPGERVADIGAGDGYFTFRLADAVGPEGHVYAVEVTDKLVERLRSEIERRGYRNVTAIRGAFGDPLLPDRGIDLAFFSGVFHHLDERQAYFERLRVDLAPGGRVAIVEGAPDPLHRLFMPFHFVGADMVAAELAAAGYRRTDAFDFLPIMSFQVFEPSA
jgi:ubiquinone/menaquinone biosynthesis C-methylase UbiE